jgi:hypothetical protein
MRASTPNMMDVFGDVREVRKTTEGPYDLNGAMCAERTQQVLEHPTGRTVLISMEADGQLANAFDEREGWLALLFPKSISEHATETSNIVAERSILVTCSHATSPVHITSVAIVSIACSESRRRRLISFSRTV